MLRDQAKRGQVLSRPESEAKNRFPDMFVASHGAQKKEKPGGILSARVLFDGTNTTCVTKSEHP